jgi:hypothetical protein
MQIYYFDISKSQIPIPKYSRSRLSLLDSYLYYSLSFVLPMPKLLNPFFYTFPYSFFAIIQNLFSNLSLALV